jgi:hypothetical protein
MMKMIALGQTCCRGGRRWLAVLAACGVAAVPSAALAGSSPGPGWPAQALATHPSARYGASMAYDAATGTVVLFGGDNGHALRDTWTWDGTTWTRQHPATSPSARLSASMAYDAATGTVVLFGGGTGSSTFGDTWIWDGTTWTSQSPATSPPARWRASVAYDATTATVLLFSGFSGTTGALNDAWTWDGTTWTKQGLPVSGLFPVEQASMAYDAATATVVLFGGYNLGTNTILHYTWTWNGTTWTKRHPASRPPALQDAPMAYDAATGTVVLFGGWSGTHSLSGTWTWNGTTWTK